MTKPVPSYVNSVLEMMMVFPTMYRSEPQCQNSIFLTTSGFEVGDDKQIYECKGWTIGKGDTLIDRTKISILGDPKKNDGDNWKLYENPCQKSAHGEWYRFPIFYSAGESTLFHYENWRPKQNNFYSKNIFNSFLNGDVELNGEWTAALNDFCSHILRISLVAYEHYRYAYYLQNGGDRKMWESRFKEDCETIPILWNSATKIKSIINPPNPNQPAPVIDMTSDWVKKKEKSIQRQLAKAKK